MRKIIKICTALAVLLALGAVLWTLQSRYRQQQETQRQVMAVEAAVAALDAGELTHWRNLAKWYNYSLEQGTPGLWAFYESTWNLGQGRMGLLEVPALGLRLPICRSGGGAVCHDPETPLPMGGRGRHTILTLSRWYFWGEGQAVYIDCLGQRIAYRVESVQVMEAGWSPERPTEAGQDLLTLVFDRRETRTIIRCVRCEELVLREGEGTVRPWSMLSALPVILFLPVLRRRSRFADRKQNHRKGEFCPQNRVKTMIF